MFQSPLNDKARCAKYQMLDRIVIKIFLFLLFSNACRLHSKSPILPITVAGAATYLELPPYANLTIRAFKILSISPSHFFS